MHIPARKGQWSQTSVCNILTNEVYLGKIRWRREPVKRVVKEGMLSKKRILNDDYELYEGRHEAIITEEQWDRVQEILNRHKHTSNHTERQLKNPFAGVLYCEKCGGIMKRYVPRPKESPTAWFRCMTRNCDCKMIKCEVAEENILNAMEEWLEEYQIQLEQTQTQTVDPIDTALETVHSQLTGLQLQQEKICEYLEKGIYSVEVFSKRNAALSKEIEQLRESETDLLRQESEGNKRNRAASELIPTTQHILDSYDALTVEEKNSLWKLVMRRATIYREPEGEVRIHIYPNLPK